MIAASVVKLIRGAVSREGSETEEDHGDDRETQLPQEPMHLIFDQVQSFVNSEHTKDTKSVCTVKDVVESISEIRDLLHVNGIIEAIVSDPDWDHSGEVNH
jgi:hypothetical protein